MNIIISILLLIMIVGLLLGHPIVLALIGPTALLWVFALLGERGLL